ncbi:cell division protein FtsQ/DivIB [Streptomyces qinzhouensis]|uniref:Cell division protein FtsQ n=1 Tax=Streptomyces qinzhouensis TaxID=2599401 RepID=A0A5B8JFU9_9ACTN|nr:FtsQ-type POTRA domain-containing protein [Streptomyces qinzhouensis]QDY76323.1 FtsQ-type POTRA domain-containing protein [Streptomyces qinzhouensis]
MAGSSTAERGVRKPSPGPSAPATRRTARIPGGPRTLLITLAVLALTAGILWALYGSSWFRVAEVSASGTRVLTPRQVVDAARVPMGEPLVSVDTDDVEARLKAALPRIDTVDVSRSWPDGITLEVTERRPVLVLEQGARFVEVDEDGVRFATVDRAPGAVPRLRLDTSGSPGLRRFDADRLIAEAVRVRRELPPRTGTELRALVVRSYDDMTAELTRGRTVVWGSPEEGEQKARALIALMKAEPKARRYDVSAPTAPATAGS